MQIKGTELKVGDIIEVWWKPGHEQIITLEPYTGPFDFVCSTAKFGIFPLGMSITRDESYEVINRHDER